MEAQCATELATAMVNQRQAKILIEAEQQSAGHWFGGGNVIQVNEKVYVCGRFRNKGDSRYGITEGERGYAFAIYELEIHDKNNINVKLLHKWTKNNIFEALKQQNQLPDNCKEVLSIEGTSLHYNKSKKIWEFYVSSEKLLNYPETVKSFQKKNTGIWSIDKICASNIDHFSFLDNQYQIYPVLSSNDPMYLHMKDPVVFSFKNENGNDMNGLFFSCAPFCWTSSFTGFAIQEQNKYKEKFSIVSNEFVPRGTCWDVACTRITSRCPILPDSNQFFCFYDGAECVNKHVNSSYNWGWSCEEVGGLFIENYNTGIPKSDCFSRISKLFPLFSSPFGTTSSRYVDAVWTSFGLIITWQQAQVNGSQPLVINILSLSEVNEILNKCN